MKCPNCGVEIRPRRAQRQSNLFHKLNAAYARAQAEDPEETKILLKYWHGPWVAYPFEDHQVPEWPGRFVELFEHTPDWCIVYLKSESAYNKAEESQLVDGALVKCMEVGADLSWMEDM